MTLARKLEVQIVGDAKGLNRAFGSASKSASSFGDKMKKAGKFAALGLAGGVALGVVALKKSVDAAMEAEKAQSRLDAAFKTTNVTAKQNAVAMDAVAKTSARAALDDEDLMDTLGRLTRVTGDVTEAQNGMSIAADLARARNLSLEASTKIVEKAYLGNVGALKRIGIEIPKVTVAQDALKESGKKATDQQIAAAKAADDTATRQSAIAALQKQYAGAAEAYGNTAAGAQERFKVAVENLQEAIGVRLLPVISRVLGWVTSNMPAFERAFRKVGDAMDDLLVVAKEVWPAIVEAARKTMVWYQTNLQPTMISVMRNIGRVWREVLGGMKKDGDGEMGLAGKLLQGRMKNILALVNSFLAVLRGDWSEAWAQLKIAVKENLMLIVSLIKGFWGKVFSLAAGIGKAIVDGIISGATGLAGRLADKLMGAVSSAKEKVLGFIRSGSPSLMFADEVGKPIGEGVVMGYILGSAPLPEKMKESVTKAIEAARTAIDAGRSKLSTAWSAATSDALSAFDAIQSGVLTKTEKLLAKLTAARAAADRAGAVTDARGALAAAQAGTTNEEGVTTIDQAAIVAAQKSLDDALWAQREFALQQRAAQERKELDAKTAMRRRDLEDALAKLGEKMQKEGMTAAKASEAVIKLMRSYGVNFKAVGAAMGEAWIDGLKETLEKAARGAGSLKGTIEGAAAGIQAPKLATGGYVEQTGLAVVHRGETVTPKGGGTQGGTQVIQLVVDRKVLAEVVRDGNAVYQRANGFA